MCLRGDSSFSGASLLFVTITKNKYDLIPTSLLLERIKRNFSSETSMYLLLKMASALQDKDKMLMCMLYLTARKTSRGIDLSSSRVDMLFLKSHQSRPIRRV